MEQHSDDSFSSGASNVPSSKISPRVGMRAWRIPPASTEYHGSSDASLFSSSLPVFSHEKLKFTELEHSVRSTDGTLSKMKDLGKNVECEDSIEDLDLQGIGIYLPNEDELLAGIMDDFDPSRVPSQVEEPEECDFFGSGGGLELDSDPIESLTIGMARTSICNGYGGNVSGHYGPPNGVGTVAGEHPYGEHPSRTLFVRNINSNVEDSELRSLFEPYGDIRTLYTACKHRGFVMISYYDIRDARAALRALQNKPLRRRKLDIHFSIPKENPSDKDINQGTLVVFNLDPSVSNDDLRQIFGAYGEVKEIRETPHKRHHKFIEFYDVRAAEAALRSLNRSDIAGKRIKLEPSRPGGARRNLMQQLNQDLDQDEMRSFIHQVGSPVTNSPPGTWAQFSSPRDNGPLRSPAQSPALGAFSPTPSNHLPGLASILPSSIANSLKVAPIGRDQNRTNRADPVFSNSMAVHGDSVHHSHSFPERISGMMPDTSSSQGTVSSFGPANLASSIGRLTGPQFLWGSPTPYSEHAQSSAWTAPSMGHSFASNGQEQSFPYTSHHGNFFGSPHHHIGSAPPGLPLEKHYGYFLESPETSFMRQVALGGTGLPQNKGSLLMNIGVRAPMNPEVPLAGSISENGRPDFRMMPLQKFGQMFFGSLPYTGQGTNGIEVLIERGRNRRVGSDNSQYQLDLEKIIRGEDNRTTLMIRNIPNKYTSKMLLAAIDENHKGTYDFFYLPIDFKNKCNMGYAFINMVSSSYIIPFYQTFNGKKWEKFNSEKVASLAYARIQGKEALVAHFQNSSLMNEDKRCRPILFHSEGPDAGDQAIQEPFLQNGVNIHIFQEDGPSSGDSPESPTENGECENLEKSRYRDMVQQKDSMLL